MGYQERILAGMPAVHGLPLDHPRPLAPGSQRGLVHSTLSADRRKGLDDLARREGVTAFGLLQTAFTVLLSRWSREAEIVMGSPAPDNPDEVRILHCQIKPEESFRDLLRRNCEQLATAFSQAAALPTNFVEDSAPGAPVACHPVYQLLFSYAAEGGGSVGEPVGMPDAAPLDLCVRVRGQTQGLEIEWDYHSELFEADSVAAMARAFEVLLESLDASLALPVARLPLIVESERRALLARPPTADYPRDTSIPALVAGQARARPDAVAVVHGGCDLTYAELERRARYVAGTLLAAGVAPGEPVGICLERGPELVVAMLGILHAGAAYVPLDINAPAARLAYMIGDTGMRLLVSDSRQAKLPGLEGPQAVRLDADLPDDASGLALPEPAGGERPACVMYTSGSTGRPKGVVIPHRGVVRLARATDYARLDADTVVSQVSNAAFDAATFEIWSALCNGGRLVVLDRDQALDPDRFARAVQAHGITTSLLTTALFHRFAQERPDCFNRLRDLLVGGEQVSVDAVRNVLAVGGPGRLVNAYGPTENSTISSWCQLRPEHVERGVMPIGRALAHSRCLVVNEAMELQPTSAVGELLVAGDGLALGYWNRDELTAERFIESPVSWGPVGRLYRTGDLVRRLPSGELQYLGRLDNQIKLRGFRIEPGEIEETLRSCSAIRDAAVVVRETDGADSRHLVAYCVPADGVAIQPAILHDTLARELPPYMLPAAYVSLPALPLTLNGKLDRNALPAPDDTAYGRAEYEAPHAGLETQLANRWRSLLKRDRIGRHDHFIALGGNSLLLARLVSELRTEFGTELTFRTVYQAGTIARLAALVETCRAEGGQNLPELAPGPDGAETPLSFAQQSLRFIDRLNGGDAGYNISYAYRLRGELDVEALRRTLQIIIMRHRSLRTVFREHEGRDFPYTLEDVEFPLVEESLPAGGVDDVDATLQAVAGSEVLRPFDLSRELMLRARLVRVAVDDHLLMLTMHHIAADGWSFALLLEEISTLYAACVAGAANPLDALPVQYADYARWQHAVLDEQRREQHLAYWREQLDNLPVVHQLPRDSSAGKSDQRRVGVIRSRLPAELVEGLQRLGLRHDATLFMTLQTAFALLLGRWSGDNDIAMGTPVANRNDPHLARLIGYFVNSVVLRTDLSGNPPFLELLARNRDMVLDAFEHQLLPFELLVEALNPERDADSTPLFQVMFVLQNNETSELSLPGLAVEPMPRQASLARFDLTLNAIPTADGMDLEWEYRADRFGTDTVERLVESYRVVLEGLLAEPQCPAMELPLLPDAERERLLAWSEHAARHVPDCTVHELFQRRAERQPEAVAVRCREQSISFGELDRRAERLADLLHAEGVGPGDLVGLCLSRTPAFLASVLAVWKAGAAYVPLDPEQPAARHTYIVEDAGIRHVLAEASFAGRFEDHGCTVFCLDRPDFEACVAASKPRPLAQTPDPHAPAYAIYTSGSTGEPKGVLVEHRAVSRLLGDTQPLGYERHTVMLQSVNLAFDASVLETWGPLCCGGQLVLYPGHGPEPSALCGLIAEYGVNSLTLPAALLDIWVEGLDAPTGLKVIVVGGEALSPETVRRLYALDDKVVVINHYGPTENGVLTSYYRIPREVPAPVPIGVPVPGTQLFVLNEARQQQPAGAVGELYVAGQGLAREYLGRPELTAEKFLPAGDAAVSARWYRTGDLVRWEAPTDGSPAVLHFVGRADAQVKIRGFRIELGEIEARLRECPAVQDARVIVHRPESGDRQLLAYVIADQEARETWRAQLQDVLPAYMVPAGFVRVQAWPLTRNGKVDLRNLPAPGRDAYTQQAFAEPTTELEKALLAIWCDLLKLDRISIDDGFFQLGGHSLLVTRLQNRIRADLGIDVALRTLFEAQTIRTLAGRLEALRDARPVDTGGTAPPPPAPVAQDASEGAPLSYSQQRLWFIHRLDSETAQYHIPCRVRLSGELDVSALRAALTELVRRHSILHTAFTEIGGEPRQVRQPFEAFELPLHDLTGLAADQRESQATRILREEALRPFNLRRGPLFRGCLVRLAATEHWLALTVHHIVADGWAMGILERELGVLYDAHRQGRAAPLDPLPLQYSDYAHWQRRWLDDAALEPHFHYWQEQLRDIPLLHHLPLDHSRPPVQSDRGALHRQKLPADLVARLEVLGRGHGATLFMVLHGAFSVLLSRFSGETDIVVGTPVANRRDESLAPLIGLFINTLVLRSDLSGEPSFADLLEQCRQRALDAYEHQDMPFELLVERLNPERSTAYSPLFQVLFALQNNESAGLELPGVDSAPVPFEDRNAKFDLALNIQPGPDGLLAEWEYNADLFEAASIERLACAYRLLLEAILADPQRPVHDLPLMEDEERERVLALGNDTARDYPQADCLNELIERRVLADPDATAVICEGERLAYAELNRRANQLAHYLRCLGVGPDVPVAIAMERSLDMVVALLAILKAGGGYVALDPDYPEARLAAMLADSAPAAVLTDAGVGGRIRAALAVAGEAGDAPVLDVADDAERWAGGKEANPEPADTGLPGSHLAYIIYTSGSTGRPKGVMNEHRGIVNRLLWMQEAYPLDGDDRFLQTAAVAFGASVVEIFWPLLAGTPLVLTRPGGHKDPAYLAALIQRERVTALHFVPSMLQAFLDHPQAAGCTSLRHIFCGGEAMSGALARRCREVLPRAQLHHLYGSSETAVLSTGWDCPDGPLPDNVPIGRPGANTRIYILDTRGRPVPSGVRGEIFVAGRQVARGYLNHPQLNSERFLPDPFHPREGERMYRTGDLGRQLPDGSIEHLGRNDFQIKIRGQRVELGEIEARLLDHDGVRQAAVVALEDDGDTRLAAYVVPSGVAAAEDSLTGDLRAHLQAHLPSHMVPAAFVVLERLPLNANGKLDRRALPTPQASSGARSVQPPDTQLERDLLAIWRDLLRQPEIGVTDDFFALGGHSLLVLRLGNRLREAFDFELDLKVFFAEPTIRALAGAIHRLQQARLAAQRFDDSDASEIIEF